MTKVKVRLRPIVHNINLPTLIKTAILPGESAGKAIYATAIRREVFT